MGWNCRRRTNRCQSVSTWQAKKPRAPTVPSVLFQPAIGRDMVTCNIFQRYAIVSQADMAEAMQSRSLSRMGIVLGMVPSPSANQQPTRARVNSCRNSSGCWCREGGYSRGVLQRLKLLIFKEAQNATHAAYGLSKYVSSTELPAFNSLSTCEALANAACVASRYRLRACELFCLPVSSSQRSGQDKQ